MDYSQTLNEIVARLHKLGDLPVFSATVNQIRQISLSEEADAMALAMAVMKDANLSVRVLKLANTPQFNPNNRPISSLSRAVIMLGFDRILNLAITIKLVESLGADKTDQRLNQLLVQAFLNAAIARELAEAAELRKAESVYLNGLLHNLGEILVAYTLPERYEHILECWQSGKASWSQAQLDDLGGEFSDIGQEFAESWGFPRALVQSMDRYTADKLQGRDRSAHQIAVGSNAILAKLYRRGDDVAQPIAKIFSDLSAQLNVRTDLIEDSIHQAYKLAAHLAEEVALPTASLKPKIQRGDDELLDELSEEIAFYLHSRDQRHMAEQPHQVTIVKEAAPSQSENLVSALSAFNQLAQDNVPATKLLETALQSVIDNTHLQRALFLISSGEPMKLTPKLEAGRDTGSLRTYFESGPDAVTLKLLRAITAKSTSLLASDLSSESWSKRLPESIVEGTGAKGLLLSSLSVSGKPLGLLYFDRIDGAIVDSDFAVVNQFLLLLRNVLESRARAIR